MTTVARLTIRPTSDGEGDLILGNMYKTQGSVLKPGRIYEIRECLGELLIVDVGPSAIKAKAQGRLGVGWENSVNDILQRGEKMQVMTEGEAAQYRLTLCT
jgi:hypothetical protein